MEKIEFVETVENQNARFPLSHRPHYFGLA